MEDGGRERERETETATKQQQQIGRSTRRKTQTTQPKAALSVLPACTLSVRGGKGGARARGGAHQGHGKVSVCHSITWYMTSRQGARGGTTTRAKGETLAHMHGHTITRHNAFDACIHTAVARRFPSMLPPPPLHCSIAAVSLAASTWVPMPVCVCACAQHTTAAPALRSSSSTRHQHSHLHQHRPLSHSNPCVRA